MSNRRTKNQKVPSNSRIDALTWALREAQRRSIGCNTETTPHIPPLKEMLREEVKKV
jgi:hypothetical protein